MHKGTVAIFFILSFAQHAMADNPVDTTFDRSNPKLLYTTREFYVDVPAGCYSNQLCLQDFFMIVQFNVGIDAGNVVRQAGFRTAELECMAKTIKGTTYQKFTITEFTSTITDNGFGVIFEGVPDATAAKSGALQKFSFTGRMNGNSLSGVLQFHTPGGIMQVTL